MIYIDIFLHTERLKYQYAFILDILIPYPSIFNSRSLCDLYVFALNYSQRNCDDYS